MICLECADPFPVKPCDRKRGWGKFCSWRCRDTHGYNSGSRNKMAKMTWDKVVEMRERYVPRKVSIRALAREYGLSNNQTHAILQNRAWK